MSRTVFDTGKRYNSAFHLSFELDHDNEDASDLTRLDFVRALLRQLGDVLHQDDLSDPFNQDDTMENPNFI